MAASQHNSVTCKCKHIALYAVFDLLGYGYEHSPATQDRFIHSYKQGLGRLVPWTDSGHAQVSVSKLQMVLLCRADADVSNGQPTGVQTCNSPGASYTVSTKYLHVGTHTLVCARSN